MLFCGKQINNCIHQKTIVSSENKKKHIAHNVNGDAVYQYRVDGDLITDTIQSRCDFLLENESKKYAYLIELKGSNLDHAVEQIENTITFYSKELNGYTVLPRIVCRSNTHKMRSSKVQKFCKKYYQKYVIKDVLIEEDITNIQIRPNVEHYNCHAPYKLDNLIK